ncbi:MAG: DUF1840 family protein [Betaproteobacteria bacterium]
MLVKFTSSKSGEMIMFANHVHELFSIIGKECTQRGVFMKDQLPDAIARLHGTVDGEKLEAKLAQMPVTVEDHSTQVMSRDTYTKIAKDNIGLVRHVHPFLHLMEMTQNEGGFILWETDTDF